MSSASRPRPRRTPPSATQRALGLLVRREHSRQELTRKLVARGVEQAEVEVAVERLSREGWQDDARFAESLLRARAGNGYGPIRIRAELRTHGLDEALVAATMDAFDGDWAERARDLVRRRFGAATANDQATRRKATAFLLRRGFAGEHAGAATGSDPTDD